MADSLKLKFGAPAQVNAAAYAAGTMYLAKKDASTADLYFDMGGTRLEVSGIEDYLQLENVPLTQNNDGDWTTTDDLYIWNQIADVPTLGTDVVDDFVDQIVIDLSKQSINSVQAVDMINDIWAGE